MAAGTPPKVFISYSHDSDPHRDRVLALANRLRADGVTAMIDRYVQSPPRGWPDWCEAQIRNADFVVMVCTETYLRRVTGEEEPGKGKGVRWEGRLSLQHLYDAGAESTKFVPVLFADGSLDHVPIPVKGASIYRVEIEEEYEALLRLLTDQPEVRQPPIGPPRVLPERIVGSPAASPPPMSEPPLVSATSPPHPRVEDVFVGRGDELKRIAAALFPANGARRPVVVSGMAGVGKSYLIDRVYWDNRERFPGGYIKLALDPANPGAAADLLAALRDRLKLPATASPADRLQMPLTLLRIENADTRAAGRVVGEVAASLPRCALVIGARFQGLGLAAGWPQAPLLPFEAATSLQQLDAELGPDAPDRASWPALAEALGHLPLALHLAAGYLQTGQSAAAFMRRLRDKNLALTSDDPADPTFLQRSRALLSETFDLSLEALRREGGAEGDAWLAGFAALGHAPASGFGASLGGAISGLSPDMFEDMTSAAARLSLIERVPRGAGNAFRLHPLLAELLRPRAEREAAFARMTEWFVARLPQGGDDQGSRWQEVHDEIAALIEWLAQSPPADRVRVERAGNWYAMINGPYHAWLRFCDESLTGEIDKAARSNFLWTLGHVALRAGLPDRALAAAEQQRDLDRKRGAERDAALAAGLIADILEARGDLDEALRLRTEEELPVYERLGDVRSRAVAQGKIADILEARGELDEALRIRTEEELPVYERLGDVRSRAITQGQIADILNGPRRIRRSPAYPHRGTAAGLRAAGRCALARDHTGQDRRHPPGARRSRRSLAHPHRATAAGLRAAGRCALARGDAGPDRRHLASARRIRRSLAHPQRGRAAGLRAAGRSALAAGRAHQPCNQSSAA